ncbi:hypothetical protein B0H66DRAFT_533291 [Apodospora peruviana]|uniref:Transmembrane protein n=1 Tax=Apodospora peruviana TaxID=516989 RepID=A0AAE0I5N9_9PEZI|nr:hypothetical protein B0H66DRAFT_533291 [Apodospora peruviana]
MYSLRYQLEQARREPAETRGILRDAAAGCASNGGKKVRFEGEAEGAEPIDVTKEAGEVDTTPAADEAVAGRVRSGGSAEATMSKAERELRQRVKEREVFWSGHIVEAHITMTTQMLKCRLAKEAREKEAREKQAQPDSVAPEPVAATTAVETSSVAEEEQVNDDVARDGILAKSTILFKNKFDNSSTFLLAALFLFLLSLVTLLTCLRLIYESIRVRVVKKWRARDTKYWDEWFYESCELWGIRSLVLFGLLAVALPVMVFWVFHLAMQGVKMWNERNVVPVVDIYPDPDHVYDPRYDHDRYLAIFNKRDQDADLSYNSIQSQHSYQSDTTNSWWNTPDSSHSSSSQTHQDDTSCQEHCIWREELEMSRRRAKFH